MRSAEYRSSPMSGVDRTNAATPSAMLSIDLYAVVHCGSDGTESIRSGVIRIMELMARLAA